MRYFLPLFLAFATTITALITCFEQFVPAFRRRYPIDRHDCYWLLSAFIHGDKVDAPMHFSRDKTKGYKLPMFMEHGTCIIGMDFIREADVGDDFTLLLAAKILSLVIDHCSDNADYKYGGGAPLGNEGRISGIVMGRRTLAKEKHKNFEPVLVHQHPTWSNAEAARYVAEKLF